MTATPAFRVEVPELDDDAIEAIAQLLVSMLDQAEQHGATNEHPAVSDRRATL